MKRRLGTLLVSAFACAVGPVVVPAQQTKATSRPLRPTPAVDRGTEAMRREAATKKKETDGNFARIKGGSISVQEVRQAEAKATPAMQKRAVAANRAQVFAVQPANGNLDPQIQQWMQQYRPILRVEYLFVRMVCDPSKDQRKQIARAGERALKAAATEFAEWQNGRRRAMVGGRIQNPEPRKIIQEGLAAAVKAHLNPAQAALYKEEAGNRLADERQAVILNLVAKLDQDLCLSADQRDKLRESLTAHWDDSWCQSLQMFMQENQYFPQIPDQFVSPFLNPVQKRVWDGIQKVQQNFFGGGMMMGDDPLDDEDLREAAREALKEAEKKK